MCAITKLVKSILFWHRAEVYVLHGWSLYQIWIKSTHSLRHQSRQTDKIYGKNIARISHSAILHAWAAGAYEHLWNHPIPDELRLNCIFFFDKGSTLNTHGRQFLCAHWTSNSQGHIHVQLRQKATSSKYICWCYVYISLQWIQSVWVNLMEFDKCFIKLFHLMMTRMLSKYCENEVGMR